MRDKERQSSPKEEEEEEIIERDILLLGSYNY
jgi:hypothetical protein